MSGPVSPPRAEAASAAPRPLDIAGAVGLLVALGLVFALDRAVPPAPLAEPPPPVAGPLVAGIAIPELPALPLPEHALATAVEPPPPPPALPSLQAAPAPAPPPPPPEEFQPKPIDTRRRLFVGFTGTNNFGLAAEVEKGAPEKRLTLNEFGETNHTLVSVNGVTYPFFQRGTIIQDLTLEGTGTADNSTKFGQGGTSEIGRISEKGPYIVKWRIGFVQFDQCVDYEANPVTRRIDTLRVRYTITNVDKVKTHTAGIRLMIDTFIGTNDGVPFFIPGRQGVIDRPLTLTGAEVPETLLALERNDLTDAKMTVAQFRFGLDNEERPGKLVLSQWPGNTAVARLNPKDQWKAVEGLPWDWKVAGIFNGDSAVGIYYAPQALKPGEKRSFNFSYGLGSLAPGGRSGMKLYSPGPFEAGKPFRVTAFVRNPKAGQTVTLTLPQGLTLAPDEKREKPVEIQAGVEVTKIDWLVNAGPSAAGKMELSGELSGTGITEKLPVFVVNEATTVHDLVVTGTPVPGGQFRLSALVLNAKPGTTATLVLPEGLALAKDEKPQVAIPAGPIGQASWVVAVAGDRSGDFTATVKLDSGAGTTKTVTVRPREPAIHKVVVTGTPSAGGAFRVTAQVLFPKAGSSAKLVLPDGLALAPGETAEKTLPAGATAQPSWVVRAGSGASGKLSLTVKLGTGPEASESVVVAPAVRELTVRLARDEPAVRGKPFWLVADVSNPKDGDAAEVQLPAGFKLAPGHEAKKPLAVKDNNGRAAWPVILDADAREAVELTVTVPGVGTKSARVTCQQGNLIGR